MMIKYLTVFIAVLVLALNAPAQDSTPASETEVVEDSEVVEPEEIDVDDPEDADLDEQTYEEDEDDFVPTEEIPADEPIPFPTNI
jgi:hypothetical protein